VSAQQESKSEFFLNERSRQMKLALGVVAILFVSSPAVLEAPRAQTTNPTPGTYITLADVQATVNRSPQAGVNPQPNIRVVDAGGYNVAVGAIHRAQSPLGGAALHYKVSEIYHVIDGSGTLVTGGTMLNAKDRPADNESVKFEDGPGASGSGIQGGVSRRVEAGDVVIIPAGVPHWFSEIQGSITYVVVRVDPNRLLPLK
jgi:mannose-6-phosphate isomerase-like protein (cupin superfamily)